jgi:galactokinase
MQNDGEGPITGGLIHETFERLYGRAPRWIARAPGRVNLIGEHTDYNGGFVLPMAIDRHTQIAAAPNDSNTITLRSTAVDEIMRIDLTRPVETADRGCWTNYPRGVLAGFIAEGYELPGFDALIHSDVPLGGGLSSSASLEVALATLLEAIVGQRLDPVRKAELCREAEHAYAQVPCGLMDQFICTLARENHVLLLDCRSQQSEWIELADPAVSVLIVKTNVRHQLAGGEYAVRRSQCAEAAKVMGVPSLREATREDMERTRGRMERTLYRRARHVLCENNRTLKAARSIRDRDWLEVGQLMYSSHESLQEDFEVSCAELDAVVEIAQNIGPQGGVFGCRMTGGGFGGCAVALIETRAQQSIELTMMQEYKAATGIEPTLFVSRPARGAALVLPAEAGAHGNA